MPDSQPKSRFELVVELIKAVAWPLIALILLIAFWTPLRQTTDLIPSIIGRSDTISIAGLSLKVSQGLKAKASPEVQRVLAKLSRSGVERVLRMSESAYWDRVPGRTYYKEDTADLLKLGLVSEVSAAEIDGLNAKEHRNYDYGVRQTELGKETQSFLQSVVAEFVEELGRQAPDQGLTK
jgi:hypothetical protein